MTVLISLNNNRVFISQIISRFSSNEHTFYVPTDNYYDNMTSMSLTWIDFNSKHFIFSEIRGKFINTE